MRNSSFWNPSFFPGEWLGNWATFTSDFDHLSRHVDQVLRPLASRTKDLQAPLGTPAFELVETEDGYQLNFDLPGIKKEDVEILLENGKLSISAERKPPEKSEGIMHRFSERRYGTFERVLTLPSDVDDTKIDAQFVDGTLEIRLKKSEAAKPRRIAIGSGQGLSPSEAIAS